MESFLRQGAKIKSSSGKSKMSENLPADRLAKPRVEALFTTEAAGLPMRRVPFVMAVSGRGLLGDRYLSGAGYYSGRCGCQLTLIAAEALEQMRDLHHVSVAAGEHRRNIVTRGLLLRELAGARLQIGEVRIAYAGPRPPCGYMERITERGMTRALGEGAGICAVILTTGVIHEGDEIVVTPPLRPPRRLP